MSDEREFTAKPSGPPEGSAYGWERGNPRYEKLVRGQPGRCECGHCQIARQHAGED